MCKTVSLQEEIKLIENKERERERERERCYK